MRPLPWIAVGYVLTALYARMHGFDVLADPVAWLIVLHGTRGLPDTVQRGLLLGVGRFAFVVSIPLWVPAVQRALADADPSLAWALSLPALAYVGLLCRELSGAAREAGEKVAPHVFSALVTLTVVVAVLPVLVFGAHLTGIDSIASVLAGLHPLIVAATLASYTTAPWSGAPVPDSAPPSGSVT